MKQNKYYVQVIDTKTNKCYGDTFKNKKDLFMAIDSFMNSDTFQISMVMKKKAVIQ